MPRLTIEQLVPISHKDVKPLYTKDEVMDKIATAVHWHRESKMRTDQGLELELIYSALKALTQ
jgi:hypothetical protein